DLRVYQSHAAVDGCVIGLLEPFRGHRVSSGCTPIAPRGDLPHNDEGRPFGRPSRSRSAGLQGSCKSYALVGRDSGGGIRTRDLRVMSPTSYQTAPPRVAN